MRRSAGILLHPTSLPGRGIGEIGASASRFVDWAAEAGFEWWQVLPLVPVGEGGSPYNGLSAMAGNPLMIDPEPLVREGLLDSSDVCETPYNGERIDHRAVTRWKNDLLRCAHAAFLAGAAPALKDPYLRFRAENSEWLDDYALFLALREDRDPSCWIDWEDPIRSRKPEALRQVREALAPEIERFSWEQFVFDRQWLALRRFAHERGVRIIGDLPIYVALDSVDVWAHPELFELDETGQPTVVSGVPPDYFAETGQRWGNPLYRWEEMERQDFRWWAERFRRILELVDLTRIDHFRGLESYWEVPAADDTALGGRWRPGPGAKLFRAVERELGHLPLIAEDLGLITPEVDALRDRLGLPGMRVLQFAFDGDPENPHLPENHPVNAVAYTGTHDNDTTAGWWSEASPEVRSRVRRLVDVDQSPNWAMIRLVLESPAALAIIPMQDLLGLGSDARMNTPGTSSSNWEWRFEEEQLTPELQARILDLIRSTGRGRDSSI